MLREEARKRRADCVRAEDKLNRALGDDARWREAWARAIGGCWLGGGGGEPSPAAVRAALRAVDELGVALKDCAELEHRIVAMERDRRELRSRGRRGRGCARRRGERRRSGAARRRDRLAGLCRPRGRAAPGREGRSARRRAGEARADRAGARAERAADVGDDRLLRGRHAHGGGGKLEDCRRRDALAAEIEAATRAIAAANVAGSFEAARAALEAVDAQALAAELEASKVEAPLDDATHAEAFSALKEAERRLDAVGGDDAVARIEEKRRTVLEEIKDGARRYLVLRAGVAAADGALKLYRDRHRGAMMERASKAFRLISRGAYRGLAATPNGQSETLIALGADGGSKEAEQLSKGARFQLYLALRVAGYHELARTRAPAPFVADDIMETFDHFRAEEALRLFADMGRVGQVIYLTHHKHLAEIAKQVCPEARVHELAA